MDARQLEVLFQFSKFLELLSNPEELKKFLSETKDAIAQQKEVLGALASKEKADLFLVDAEKSLALAKQKIESDEISHQNKMKDEQDAITKTKLDLQNELNKVVAKQAEVSEQNTIANSFLKQAKEKLEEAIRLGNENSKKSVELANKEAELQEKSDKLKQLLG